MDRFRFTLFALLFLAIAICSYGQNPDTVKVQGQVIADKGTTFRPNHSLVYLDPVNPDDAYATTIVDAQGSFNVPVPLHGLSMYTLRYRNYKMDVLLCPWEPVFQVEITTDDMGIKNMRVVGSHEYDAFRAYKKVVDDFRNKVPAFANTSSARIEKFIVSLDTTLKGIRGKYKGTYVANILIPMATLSTIETSQPALPQLQRHFFDGVPFTDSLLYSTNELESQMNSYLDNIADTSAAGRLAFIEMITNKALKNVGDERELLFQLLENFIDNKRESYLASMVQWARAHPSINDDYPVIAAKLQLVAKTLPGSKAADVTGNDPNGQSLSLSSVVSKNKLTLLLFWSSECPHCQKEMPNIVSLYRKYHSKGLEVFAASTEPYVEEWKQFVVTHQLPFQNIKLPDNNTAHEDYFIEFTPTFVLIDSSGIILHRYIKADDLDETIGKILSK